MVLLLTRSIVTKSFCCLIQGRSRLLVKTLISFILVLIPIQISSATHIDEMLSIESGFHRTESEIMMHAMLICSALEKRGDFGLKSLYVEDIVKWQESINEKVKGCKIKVYKEGKELFGDSRTFADEVRIYVPGDRIFIRYYLHGSNGSFGGVSTKRVLLSDTLSRELVLMPADGVSSLNNSEEVFDKRAPTHGISGLEKTEEQSEVVSGEEEDFAGKIGKGYSARSRNKYSIWQFKGTEFEILNSAWKELFSRIKISRIPREQKRRINAVAGIICDMVKKGNIRAFNAPIIGPENYLFSFVRNGFLVISEELVDDVNSGKVQVEYLAEIMFRAVYYKEFGLPEGEEDKALERFFASGLETRELSRFLMDYMKPKLFEFTFAFHQIFSDLFYMDPRGSEYDRIFKFNLNGNVLEALIAWSDNKWTYRFNEQPSNTLEHELDDMDYYHEWGVLECNALLAKVRVNLETKKIELFRPSKKGGVFKLEPGHGFVEVSDNGVITVLFRNIMRERMPYNAAVTYKLTFTPWAEKSRLVFEEMYKMIEADQIRHKWTEISNRTGKMELTRTRNVNLHHEFGAKEPWYNIKTYSKKYKKRLSNIDRIVAEAARLRNSVVYDMDKMLRYPGCKDPQDTNRNLEDIVFNVETKISDPRGITKKSVTFNRKDFCDSKEPFEEYIGRLAAEMKRIYAVPDDRIIVVVKLNVSRDPSDPKKMNIGMDVIIELLYRDALKLEPCDPEKETEATLELLNKFALPYDQKIVVIGYDESRLTDSQEEIIKEYRRLLIRAFKCDESSIKLEPYSSERGSKRPLIGIYRYTLTGYIRRAGSMFGDGYGEIEVDKDVQDEELPVVALLNMALAASHLKMDGRFDRKDYQLIEFIRVQYCLCTGINTLGYYFEEQGELAKILSSGFRKIILKSVKPLKSDYFILSRKALVSA